MNEKERIIELVRQKIISMDEALRLLEAGGVEADSTELLSEQEERPAFKEVKGSILKTDKEKVASQSKNEKNDLNHFIRTVVDQAVNVGSTVVKEVSQVGNQVMKDVNDSIEKHKNTNQAKDSTPKSEEVEEVEYQAQTAECQTKGQAISQQIEELNEQLHQLTEEKIILQQRQREIEILSEIEDLTDEMKSQLTDLSEKEGQIVLKISDLEERLEVVYAQQEKLHQDCQENQQADPEFKRFINNSSQMISEQAQQFKEEASREGKKIGKQVIDFVKSTVDSIASKDVNIPFPMPWQKVQSLTHQFTYDVATVEDLDFDIINGDVQFQGYDGDDIQIDTTIRYQGGEEAFDLDKFHEMSTLIQEEGKLIFHVSSLKLSTDLTVKIPKKDLNIVQIKTLNGDIQVVDLSTQYLSMKSKRGDLKLKLAHAHEVILDTKLGDVKLAEIESDLVDLDLVNGDVKVKRSEVKTTILNNINGDCRLVGPIGDVKAKSVNGDFYLTKEDLQSANIAIDSVHGDIKISLPKGIAFDAHGKTAEGRVMHRFENLDKEELSQDGKSFDFGRGNTQGQEHVQLDLSITMGDFYLKDGVDLSQETETGKEE